MGELHPVTATVKNASAPLVICRSSQTEEEKMVVFLKPSYSAASLSLALVRKQPENFLFLHFYLLISNHKQFSFFILPLNHFKIGLPPVFVLCLSIKNKLYFFGGLFFIYFSELHNAAPCWRSVSVAQ